MKTKRSQLTGVVLGLMLLVFGCLMPVFGMGGHYTPGEGLKVASFPPPGAYYRQYNNFYEADALNDADGNKIDNDLDLTVLAQAHRFIYISDIKILGGNWGMNLIIPVVAGEIALTPVPGVDVAGSNIGLGDILVEPLAVGWHGKRWDYTAGLALTLPTGKCDEDDAFQVGKGYYSGMLTTGDTVYLDEARSWTLSVLTRTLKYTEQKDTEITPGWEFIADWGFGKELPVSQKVILGAGVCGYGYWQITEDSGTGASSDKGEVYAAGAEINLAYIPTFMQVSLRMLKEFGAKDEAEGSKVVLTISNAF